MKKLAALAATALVVIAGSQLIASVGATTQSSINKRVSILEKKTKSLQSQVTVLKARAACLGALGVTEYGNPTGTPATGYIYTNDGGATAVITTALDATEQGQTPGAFFATINSGCISGSAKGAFARATLRGHRVGPATRLQLRPH